MEAAKAIVETKKSDLDNNKSQLSKLTAEVSALGDKCQAVWKLYEERRQEYLERSSAPAESAWPAAGKVYSTRRSGLLRVFFSIFMLPIFVCFMKSCMKYLEISSGSADSAWLTSSKFKVPVDQNSKEILQYHRLSTIKYPYW